MIKPSDFKDWQEYYWTYQNILAKKYLIPMLKRRGISINGKKVFEIGCGNGGVIEAFAEGCRKAVGLDRVPFDYSKHNSSAVKYITADLFDQNFFNEYQDQYDIILLRDVIEHLPQKREVFEICDKLLADDGILFFTFPPFYSPFGAHQHVYSKTTLGKLPYMQLLPKSLYLKYVRAVEDGNRDALNAVEEIVKSRTTISSLNKVIKQSPFEIFYQEYYLTRPSFEIRYGVRPLKVQVLRYIPLLQELLVMGVHMILKRKKKNV